MRRTHSCVRRPHSWGRSFPIPPRPRSRIQSRQSSEFRRAQSHVALEQKRQVALIRKTAHQRDFGQRRPRVRQQMRRVLNPALSDQFARRYSGCTCGTGAIDAHSAPRPRTQSRSELSRSRNRDFHDLRRLLQPTRGRARTLSAASDRAISARISSTSPSMSHRRRRILTRELGIQPIGKPSNGESAHLSRSHRD